jgi:hypothetical protein
MNIHIYRRPLEALDPRGQALSAASAALLVVGLRCPRRPQRSHRLYYKCSRYLWAGGCRC